MSMEYLIETFKAGPGDTMPAVVQWLKKSDSEGWEFAAAYGVPHPTGNAVLHTYVLRRPVAPAAAKGRGR